MQINKNSKRNVAIQQISTNDLIYYFKVTQNSKHNEAIEKAYEIADFMLTDFGCSYRKGSKGRLNNALRKYGEENIITGGL